MRLRFWLKSGWDVLVNTAGMSALYCVVMCIQIENDGWQDILTMLPIYLILFGALVFAISAFGLYKMTISLVLSFGSTRREVLLGLQLYRLLPAAGIALLAALLTMIPSVEPVFSPGTAFLISLGVFLLGGAAGAILGMVAYRFGKVGTVITAICVGLFGSGLGVMGSLSIAGGGYDLRAPGSLPWLLLALGAAVYLLVMIPEIRVVRGYQVRQ